MVIICRDTQASSDCQQVCTAWAWRPAWDCNTGMDLFRLFLTWMTDASVCKDQGHYNALFWLGITRTSFTIRMVRHWSRFLGEFGESPSLKIFKTSLNKSLSNVAQIQCLPCFQQEADLDDLKVHSKLICSLCVWISITTLKTEVEVIITLSQLMEIFVIQQNPACSWNQCYGGSNSYII